MYKRLFVCGDIVNQFFNDQFIDSSLISVIKSADHAIANFEGVLSLDVKIRDEMTQDITTLTSLMDAGFDTFLLANNHITDYGLKAMLHTIDSICEKGLNYLGAGVCYEDVYKPLVLDEQIVLLNICEAHPHYYHDKEQKYGFAWLGDVNLGIRIKKLKLYYSKLIIFVHAGLEHYECPLKFYRDFYRNLCDLGADAVIAAHPHIAQGIEYYGDKLICYSLGNFFFPRERNADYKSDRENSSYSLFLDIMEDSIKYELVYHRIENGKVCRVSKNDSYISIETLNNLLNKDYDINHLNMINQSYNLLVKQLYKQSLNSIDANDSLIVKLKETLKYLFLKKKFFGNIEYKNRTLTHLINNETYRAVINAKFAQDYAREYE